LDGVVTADNAFGCDGGSAIVSFARHAGITAPVLPVPGKPNPAAPAFHLNNVNAYQGRLKAWMRRFHGVATKTAVEPRIGSALQICDSPIGKSRRQRPVGFATHCSRAHAQVHDSPALFPFG
jgi:hypothetical protein